LVPRPKVWAAEVAGPEIEADDVRLVQQKVWGYRQGQLVTTMMHLGDRLGIYRAMQGAGPLTAAELALASGLHERWLLEWLRSQAAAGLIESPDGESFELTAAAGEVLANDAALTFAGSALSPPRGPEVIDRLAESFKTGIGLTYDDLGPGEADHVERAFGNWTAHTLVPRFVPAVDGLAGRLTAGARVADVGCGTGLALRLLAAEYPNSDFSGFELSQHAIDKAVENAAADGVAIDFHNVTETSLGDKAPFDVVLTLDCLHDMTRPDDVAADIHASLADDGVWLVKEIRSTPDFTQNRKNPLLAMMYATSVSVCLSSAMSEPDGAGYGTLGLNPEALRDLVTTAGFTSIERHEFDDPINLYYSITK